MSPISNCSMKHIWLIFLVLILHSCHSMFSRRMHVRWCGCGARRLPLGSLEGMCSISLGPAAKTSYMRHRLFLILTSPISNCSMKHLWLLFLVLPPDTRYYRAIPNNAREGKKIRQKAGDRVTRRKILFFYETMPVMAPTADNQL
jgi:hypothetical protein